MLTVVQRVSHAQVEIDGEIAGQITQGLLILCGFEATDTAETLDKMLYKCVNYRIFSDAQDKMNLCVKDINGGLLLVPQFTLIADTQKGLRPSFSKGAQVPQGQQLFNQLIAKAQSIIPATQSGVFGADMQVSLCNDGPATFILAFN